MYKKHDNKKLRIAAAVVAILLVFAMVVGCVAAAFADEGAAPAVRNYEMKINYAAEGVLPRGVSFEGISLEGKTLAEARQEIQAYADARVNRSVVFSVMGHTYEYHGYDFGVTWTNPEVVNQIDNLTLKGNVIDQYKLQKDVDANPVSLDLAFTFDETYTVNQISALVDTYTVEPKNSAISRLEDGSFTVTDSLDGVEFNRQAITDSVLAGLRDFSTADEFRYDFPYTDLPAAYTREDFNFSTVPLGSYTTYNIGSGNRRQNVINSANKMNGHFFYPGETISALAMYGDMTVENGYAYAPGYEMGKQVDTVGGGICQTTTTLYNAVLRAELTVGYRRNHSMVVLYVPPAMDATVAPPYSDFTFVNSTGYPIYIESYVYEDSVTVKIWGVETRPANRTIDFQTEISELVWPSVLYNQGIDDTNLRMGGVFFGYKIRTEIDPHPAIKAKSYKLVFVDGQLQSRDLLNSDVYEPMSGLLYHTSDCQVAVSVEPSSSPDAVYKFFGWTIRLTVQDLSGNSWPYYPQ